MGVGRGIKQTKSKAKTKNNNRKPQPNNNNNNNKKVTQSTHTIKSFGKIQLYIPGDPQRVQLGNATTTITAETEAAGVFGNFVRLDLVTFNHVFIQRSLHRKR